DITSRVGEGISTRVDTAPLARRGTAGDRRWPGRQWLGRAGRDGATFWAYRGASGLARRLPPGPPLPEAVGRAAAAMMPGRRALVAAHLRRALGPGVPEPDLQAAVGAAFASYARFWRDSFRLPTLSRAEVRASVAGEGIRHLRAGMARGRGVILALPHLGSWDYGAAWLAVTGYPMVVVVEPLPGDALFAWLVRMRLVLGIGVVPLGPGAVPTLTAALRAGRLVGLLCDRDIGGSGVTVPFFGEETTLPGGPATLALRTGAQLMPACVLDEPGGRHLAVVRPPIPVERAGSLPGDIARITASMAAELEVMIRRAPEQWHLFQPNWPGDPRPGSGS
ncbi:MAG: phosphatidylinositol mannoside acyltransferase, partial [Acidimicrobiales bacterium]